MPINRDLGDLPRGGGDEGEWPVPPQYVKTLAEAWLEVYREQGRDVKAMSIGQRLFRASWAGMCARAVAYNVAEAEPTAPNGIAEYWRFGLGQLVHEGLDEPIRRAFPGARFEVPVDLRPIGIDGAATADYVELIDPDGEVVAGNVKVVGEWKSINGFGFKVHATSFKGPPEGPRFSAKVQGALSAMALDAELLVIGYLSLENVGPDLVKYAGDDPVARFAAEWHYTRDQYRPVAEREVKRVARILDLVTVNGEAKDEEALLLGAATVPRSIPELPAGNRITDPARKLWVVADQENKIRLSGSTWHCDYCDHRPRCVEDGP